MEAYVHLKMGNLGIIHLLRGAKRSHLLLYQPRSHVKYQPLGRPGKVRRPEILSVKISPKAC